EDLPAGGRGRARGRPTARGRRPAHDRAAGPGDDLRIGQEDAAGGRRTRGAVHTRAGGGDRGAGGRGGLLPPRGAGGAGGRGRHPVSAVADGRGVPARPGPGARRCRPGDGVLMGVLQFRLPDVGEGLVEAEIVSWKVKPGDTVKLNDTVVEIETAKSLVE